VHREQNVGARITAQTIVGPDLHKKRMGDALRKLSAKLSHCRFCMSLCRFCMTATIDAQAPSDHGYRCKQSTRGEPGFYRRL